jgi:hypothetical protein
VLIAHNAQLVTSVVTVAPAEEVPAAHAVHTTFADAVPTEATKVPAAHEAVHAVQVVTAVLDVAPAEKVPAAHAVQTMSADAEPRVAR